MYVTYHYDSPNTEKLQYVKLRYVNRRSTYKQTRYLPKQINKMYVLLSVAQKTLNYPYFCFSFKEFVTFFFTLTHTL